MNNKKATILIVDDMTTNIEILSDLLKDDYELKIAKNGKKAIEIVNSNNKIDLILLDVVMPEMDGYEVCKTLKNNNLTQNIPIVFVTGNDSPLDEEYGLNLGAVDYIKKPFHPSIVKIRVRNHIKLKLKSDLLEELSMCDALTHVANRRSFDENLEVKFKESQREKVSFGLMMIDIDHFKPYNDNYGHGKGDETLIKVATALSRTLKRPSDMVARYGGEEFAVILKDMDKDGIKNLATMLVESVSELKIPHKHSSCANFVTISVGVALKKADEEMSVQELLKKADEKLYESKDSGRNRYSI